jgi:ABC-type transport system substrate-binding protein
LDERHQRETLAFLRETLGLSVGGDLDPTGYTKMAQGTTEKRLIFTLNYDNGWNELDDWVYPYFHSRGTKNTFNLSDPELDSMLEAQRAEFDYERRRQIGLDLQRYLLDNVLARLDWVAQVSLAPAWPYLKNHWLQPWYGYLYIFLPNTWLDSTDPTFAGRSA